jgi:hypothetical protein
MTRKSLTVGLCLAAVSLAACDGHGRMAANRGICFNFSKTGPAAAPAASSTPAGTAAAAAGDPSAAMDDCVRRWAYSLAPSRDAAQAVSEAAVAACTSALTRWNEQALGQAAAPAAPSITTGEPTNPLAEHNSFAHARALLYVVEARAGRCAPPPATNGVPEGAG